MEKIYSLVKEIKETSDIKEVAKLLSTKSWVAISATTSPIKIILGKIN